MKNRKKFILQKKLYGTKQLISVFNIVDFFLVKELKLANSFYGNNIDDSNKENFLKTTKNFSLSKAKQGVYISPLMVLEHESKFNYCINEDDISSILKFMVIELLPLFEFKETYTAVLLYDIYRADWFEDEAGYAKGAYFLRDFLTKNSISYLIKKTEFTTKFLNYLFLKINWGLQINRQKGLRGYPQSITKKEWEDQRSLDSFDEEMDQTNYGTNSLFKNVALSANMGCDMTESMQFESDDRFEESIKDIFRCNRPGIIKKPKLYY